jgi:SHS family lactate transporter-like MFS transporter
MTTAGAPLDSSTAQAAPTPSVRRRILVAATLGTLFDGADFAIFLIFLVPLAKHFHVSVLTMSGIQATSYVAGIIGGILFGAMADRRGRRPALAAAVAIFSVFTLATALVPNVTWLLVVRVFAGIGLGGESGVAFSLINEAHPGRGSKRGARSGWLQSMFIFGNFLAFGVFQLTSHFYGQDAWRWAYGYLGIAAVLALAVRLWMPESPHWLRQRNQSGEKPPAVSATVRELISPPLRRPILISTLMMTAAFFGAYAVISYAPSMWQQSFGLPAGVVAQLGYAGSITAIIGYLTNGYLSDIIGRRAAFVAFGVLGTVAYILFGTVTLGFHVTPTSASIWASPVFVVFLLVELGYGYHGAQGVWLSELFPTRVRATAQNVVYYVGRALGAGLAPFLALLVAQGVGQDFRLAITLGVLGAAGTALVALKLPETRGKPLKL